jgi:hypothetical protein
MEKDDPEINNENMEEEIDELLALEEELDEETLALVRSKIRDDDINSFLMKPTKTKVKVEKKEKPVENKLSLILNFNQVLSPEDKK